MYGCVWQLVINEYVCMYAHASSQNHKPTLMLWFVYDSCDIERTLHIVKTTALIPTKFCTTIETTKYSSWLVQIRARQIQDGGRPPFWKTVKSRYLHNHLTYFDQILCILKIQYGGSRHIGSFWSKLLYLTNGSTSLHKIWHMMQNGSLKCVGH